MTEINHIEHGGILYAIIVSHSFNPAGTNFITEPHHPQQVAYMRRPKGSEVAPHFHKPTMRRIERTQEVLLIRKGRLQCSIFNSEQQRIHSCVVGPGDLVVLLEGGHSFSMLQDVEMIEVKQGPYTGPKDKIFFDQ